MGEVFRATDTKLGREVALKVLPEALAEDEGRLARFQREAKTVASLSHPNIVTIFSVEEDQGLRFLTMELVAGKTLYELLPPDGFPLDRLLALAIPIADAVAGAHACGVVHRDLKPANVMVADESDLVKVLDFGLAKLTAAGNGDQDDASSQIETATQTQEGTIAGTPHYMSPEQVRGDRIDHRTDIFSLGVVLFEMATGKRPFEGTSAIELMSSVLKDRPQSLTEIKADLPNHLGRVIGRCLEKAPNDRYQTARDVNNELKALRRETAAATETSMARPAPSPTPETSKAVAVLPFANMSPDAQDEFFSDGLTEELINALARVPGLRVASRSAAFRFKESSQDVRSIGAELGVGSIVEGSVRRAGDRVRVTTQLVETGTGYQVWSERYDRILDDVFALQDELTETIVAKLEVDLTPLAAESRPHRAKNIAAYDLFLEGRFHLELHTPDGYARAAELLEKAKTADPSFAPPYVWQASTLVYTANFGLAHPREVMPLAKELVLKAVELDERSAEAQIALALVAQYWDWDWEATEAAYLRALELAPGDSVTRAWYAIFLARFPHRWDDCRHEAVRAVELDPTGFETNTASARALLANDLDQALACAEAAIRFYPDRAMSYFTMGAVRNERGEFEEARENLEHGRKLDRVYPLGTAHLAHSLGRLGETDRAKSILDEMVLPGSDYRPALFQAWAWAGIGDVDRTLDLLEEAFECRDGVLTFVHVLRTFQPIWDEPRFLELRRKAGF